MAFLAFIDHLKRELASFLPRCDPAISPCANNPRKHLLRSLSHLSIRSTKIPSKSSPSSLVPTSSNHVLVFNKHNRKLTRIPYPAANKNPSTKPRKSTNHVCIRHRRHRLEEVDFQALERRFATALRLVLSSAGEGHGPIF